MQVVAAMPLCAPSCFEYGDTALLQSQILFQRLITAILCRRKVKRLNNLDIFFSEKHKVI